MKVIVIALLLLSISFVCADDIQDAILTAHNNARAAVHQHALTWNANAASQATSWANVSYAIMLLRYYVIMLLCCYAIMLLCCYAVMLLCYYAVVLLCCCAIMLLCCCAVMLLC